MIGIALLIALGAETIHIAGQVVDAKTQQPVADAVVIIDAAPGAQETTEVTDEKGRFEVDAPLGTFKVSVHREGYSPFARTESLVGSANDYRIAIAPEIL